MTELQNDVLELWKKGYNDKEIAEKLFWTVSYIGIIRRGLGLPRHKRKRVKDLYSDQIKELYDDGLNDREISKELGISPQEVGAWRHEHGNPKLNIRGRPRTRNITF